MKSIFAPWRLDWVTRDRDETNGECIFCSIATQDCDRENRVIARSDDVFVLLNNSPYNPGHSMIVPKVHVGEYTELDASTLLQVGIVEQETMEVISNVFDPEGFNVGMNIGKAGGASITDHLHIHVIPRWHSDTTFMPTSANTNIVEEALDVTYDRLYDAFASRERTDSEDSKSAVRIDVSN